MPTVENEVIIIAPVEKVFGYLRQPSNLQKIWPSLVDVTNETILANGGYSYQWTYKMSGIKLTGRGECVDIKQNSLLSSKNTGAINSTVSFRFQCMGIHTRVILTIDYEIPLPLFGHFAENIVLKMNEKEAELILDNLRIIFEESQPLSSILNTNSIIKVR